MTIAIIPTLQDAEALHYSQRVRLDGVDYAMTLLFSERRSVWTFSLATLDGVAVLTGQSIVCGLPLGGRAVGGPPGVLIAISDTADLTPPGLLDLGGRVKLWYLDADDPLVAG